MGKRELKILGLLFLIATGKAWGNAYKHCDSILHGGAFNLYMTTRSSASQSGLRQWLCHQEFQEGQTELNTKISATYKILSGQVDFSQKKFESWKLDHCETSDYFSSASADSFNFLQLASPEIVRAWKDCISKENNGLVCFAVPKDEQNEKLEFHVEWTWRFGSLKNIYIDLDNLAPLRTRPFPTEIIPGEKIFNFKREDLKAEGSVIFEGEALDSHLPFSVACAYSVPPKVIKERGKGPDALPERKCHVRVGEKAFTERKEGKDLVDTFFVNGDQGDCPLTDPLSGDRGKFEAPFRCLLKKTYPQAIEIKNYKWYAVPERGVAYGAGVQMDVVLPLFEERKGEDCP